MPVSVSLVGIRRQRLEQGQKSSDTPRKAVSRLTWLGAALVESIEVVLCGCVLQARAYLFSPISKYSQELNRLQHYQIDAENAVVSLLGSFQNIAT